MSKIIIIIPLLVIIFSLIIFFRPLKTSKIIINNHQFNLEIADNPVLLSRGLSNRTSLCSNCGMLFKMGFDGIHPFWMKDTLIPLDMIWIDKEGIVTDIITAQPQPNKTLNQLTLYKNSKPARYIIELNAKTCQSINLSIGDKISLP